MAVPIKNTLFAYKIKQFGGKCLILMGKSLALFETEV